MKNPSGTHTGRLAGKNAIITGAAGYVLFHSTVFGLSLSTGQVTQGQHLTFISSLSLKLIPVTVEQLIHRLLLIFIVGALAWKQAFCLQEKARGF